MNRRCFLAISGGAVIAAACPAWALPEDIPPGTEVSGSFSLDLTGLIGRDGHPVQARLKLRWLGLFAGQHITLESGGARYHLLVTSTRRDDNTLTIEVTGTREE